MSNTIRITSAGNFYANSFDEVTFNSNSGYTKNILYNSNFVGGTSGTWTSPTVGAGIPTNYISSGGSGSVVFAPALSGIGNSCRFYGTNVRPYLNQYNFQPIYTNVTYTYTVTIENVSVSTSPSSTFIFVGNSNPSPSYSYYINGVSVNSFTPIPVGTTGKLQCVFTFPYSPYGVAFPATALVWRIGLGTSNFDSGDITLANPQIEIGNTVTTSSSIISYQPTTPTGNLATINAVSKISSSGDNYIAGQFDEVTYNPSSNAFVNLINSSQNLSAGSWGFTTGVTVSGTLYTAPDGTQTAQDLIETATNSHLIGNFCTAVQGLNYTWSIYLKKGVGSTAPDWVQLAGYFLNFNSAYVNFNLTTGTVGIQSGVVRASMTNAGNGWWRCSITVTSTVNTTTGWMFVGFINNLNQSARLPSYAGATTSDVLVWGAQLEQNSVASIYQPVNASNLITSTFTQRVTNTGNTYVLRSYDEVTGVLPISNGLIYYFDPGKSESYSGSGTAIADITKNSSNGVLNGGFTYSNDFGGIIKFDGASTGPSSSGTGYANTNVVANASTFQTNSNYTLSVWCRFEKPTTYHDPGQSATGGIFSWTYFAGYGIMWQSDTNGNITGVATGSSGVYAHVRVNGTYETFTSTYGNLILNQWYNFVMVYNSSGVYTLYVNGSAYGSNGNVIQGYYGNTSAPTLGLGRADIEGGGQTFAGRQTFPGSIGQSLIYNRALSASEVAQNFNAIRGRYGV